MQLYEKHTCTWNEVRTGVCVEIIAIIMAGWGCLEDFFLCVRTFSVANYIVFKNVVCVCVCMRADKKNTKHLELSSGGQAP